MKIALALIAAVSIFSSVDVKAQEMVTDRPDQTESAEITPRKRVQVEAGYLYEKSEDDAAEVTGSSVGTLIRYGLFDILELRMGAEYKHQKISVSAPGFTDESSSGFTPLSLGAKLLLAREKGALPQTALLFHISIPDAASEEFKTVYGAPSLKLCMSNTLSDRLSLGYNIGGEMDSFTNEFEAIYTVSLGASLSDKVGAFAEVFGSAGDEHRINADGGITYSVRENLQLDISGGLDLDTKDYFIGTGISVRFPK
jgi:hypothetical protein